MNTPIIDFLLDAPDNVEIIRDQISKILVLELKNQHQLAVAAEDPDVSDYDVDVFVENDEPLQFLQEENSFSHVNIMLQNTVCEKGSTNIDMRKMLATFFIDCCIIQKDFTRRESVLKSWKLGRLVRNILSAGDYTYLKLPKTVGSKIITKMETIISSELIEMCVCRVELVVGYSEFSPQTGGPNLERISVVASNESGRKLFDI